MTNPGLIFLLVLFCSLSFAQGWNSTVTTSINEPNLEKMDLTANASGIHALIKRTNGNIVYYFLNSSGTVNSGKTYTMEADGDFPNIVASDYVIYALYKAGSNIKGKYSTNGGTSWSNLPNNINTTANLCNGVDAEYQDQQGVHIVWATRDNYPDFETYYYRLRPSDNQWVEFKNVTDHSSAQVGGRPSVSFSSGRVHVSFNTSYYEEPYGPGNAGTRDRLNGVWQTPQSVITGSEETVREKLLVRGSTLFMFYAKWNFRGGLITNDLVYRTRNVSGTTWSSPATLAQTIEEFGNAFYLTKTTNDNVHLIYYPEYVDPNFGLAYRSFNGSSWSSPILLDTDPKYGRNVGLTSTSNDLFITFMTDSDNYMRYRHNDQSPLAPQNLTVTKNASAHPVLNWNKNNEADLKEYIIDRAEWGVWSYDIARTTNNSYVDNKVDINPMFLDEISYKVRAVDKTEHISASSNTVTITNAVLHKENLISENSFDYELSSAYPNPFNPSTRITYSIKE
jgi:hypothetical protein